MLLLVSAIVVAGLVMGVFHLWQTAAAAPPAPVRAFLAWVAKGLLGPLAIWTFANSGILHRPVIPRFAQALADGNWWQVFLPATAALSIIITSWWATVTAAWLVWQMSVRLHQPAACCRVAASWSVIGLPLALVLALLFHMAGLGLGLAVWLGSIACGLATLLPLRLPPSYSKAIARINFDKFNEAELEIIHQLEKSESDFDGWMLLAELYATHFHDLPAAERTLCELCDDPHTTPAQAAQALHRLADWHLKYSADPDRARWALEQLCQRLPGSHLEHMARQRLQSLPATREALLRERQGRTIPLPKDGAAPTVQLPDPAAAPACDPLPAPRPLPRLQPPADPRQTALAEARRCVEQLTANPDDLETREHFACLLAGPIDQPATAIDQLDLLLALPGQPDARRAAWLAQQADWHAHRRQDVPAAQAALRRITEEYPQTSHAFEAQRRLYALQLETTVRQRRKSTPPLKVTLLRKP